MITSDGQEPTRNSSGCPAAAPDQLRHDAVEFVVGVGQAGEVALVDDGGREARLGEDHHAGGGLDQMRAGARADHQEERVLDLAVQPDDAGQAAEHLALAALDAGPESRRTPRTAPRRPRSLRVASRRVAQRAGHHRRLLLQPGRAQLQQELRGVDDVAGIGRQRQQHQALGVDCAGEQRDQIGGVQRQHQHAENVFPEERRGKQVAAEDLTFPDRAGDHDGVEQHGLDHDRGGGVANPWPVAR